eukprot:CAMPEP_0174309732 /NCGR_PEP_ID=MMETSP0810-20121108/2600_1 /TAXON_ID=73025 ORGANISM="Eutreptiella gymnastica-like, Strain CCMP1594" /NCGR_SAMPLE_ID=MMETSP0810 /ASSEMBLY_ACC=CAM_ASM_000659 /LENGTH=80 /DNA_ID=CAMNT_0015417451 /DNA_START=849 /DNA_END=1087 /DNA_ORIENTATION=-
MGQKNLSSESRANLLGLSKKTGPVERLKNMWRYTQIPGANWTAPVPPTPVARTTANALKMTETAPSVALPRALFSPGGVG